MARGTCQICGSDVALTSKYLARKHGDCEGNGKAPAYDDSCSRCQSDDHRCLGCGNPVGHHEGACEACSWDGTVKAEEKASPAPPDPQAVVQQAAALTTEAESDDFLMGGPSGTGDADDDDNWLMEPDADDREDRLFGANSRYRMPDPVTGIPKLWTRATTMAETISDLYSLNLWRLRMATIGYVRYPNLIEELRELEYLDPKDHKDQLNKAASKAQWLAGSKVPASWGTNLHKNIERWSREEMAFTEADPVYANELAAYVTAMQEWELSPVPSLIERRVCVPLYGVAGTLDQAVRVHRTRTLRAFGKTLRLEGGQHVIGDVKSGKDLDYAWREIAIQLALYAHGLKEGRVLVWDENAHDPKYPTPGAWVWEKTEIDPASVRTDVGVVMHIPVDRPEDEPAKCTLYWVDLEAGWKAVQLCEAVRDWRKSKGLAVPVSVSEVATGKRPTVRDASWDERFASVQTADQAREVRREWLASGGRKGSTEDQRLIGIAKRHLRGLVEGSA
jgi:hypothetical protein